MNIPLNAEVHCPDGAAGRSTVIVVDPQTKKVTHVVVESKGTEYLVPIDAISESGTDHILLRSVELSYLSEEQVPENELAIHRGAHVEASDGGVGHVDEFLIDSATGQITHLVLRQGHLWGKKDVTVPLAAIDRIQENVVFLKLDKAAVEQLPHIPVKGR